MKPLPESSWVRILAGVTLALAAGEFLSPAQARAACGDYVTVGTETSHHSNSPPRKPNVQHAHPEPGNAPCHGPRCGKEQTPPPPPSSTVPLRVQDVACMLLDFLMNPNETNPWCPPQESLVRNHLSSLIYHPPRSV